MLVHRAKIIRPLHNVEMGSMICHNDCLPAHADLILLLLLLPCRLACLLRLSFFLTVFTYLLSMLLLFGGRIEVRIHHAPYTSTINHPVLCITFVPHPKPRSFPNLLERLQQDYKQELQDAHLPPDSVERDLETCAFPN